MGTPHPKQAQDPVVAPGLPGSTGNALVTSTSQLVYPNDTSIAHINAVRANAAPEDFGEKGDNLVDGGTDGGY